MTVLTEQQRIALAVVPKVSSVFSLFGSVWIIVEVATARTKRGVPYHRLLLAMSVYDVLESIWNFLSTWPIPSDSSGYAMWAYGNTATCTAQGFFLTLSSAVPLYNAMLSWYYVLVINYNYSDTKLRGFVEPAMHIFCFVWAFGTALYSSLAGLINNADLWCWIAPLPADCKDSWTHGSGPENDNPCIRGDNVWIYRFGFYFIPLWMSIAVATVSTYMVWKFVFQQDEKTLRYRRPDRKVEMWTTKMKSFRRSWTRKFSSTRKLSTGIPPASGNSNMGQVPAAAEEAKEEKESHPEAAAAAAASSSKKPISSSGSLAGLASLPEDKVPEDIMGDHSSAMMEEHDVDGSNRSSGGSNLLPSQRKEVSLGLESVPEYSEGVYDDSESSPSMSKGRKERPKLEDNTPHNLKRSMRELSQERQPTGAWSISMMKRQESQSSAMSTDSADISAAQDELARRAAAQRQAAAIPTSLRGQLLLLERQTSSISVESTDISAAQDELAKRAAQKQQAAMAASERESERLATAAANKRKTIWQRWKEWKEKRAEFARDMPHTVEVFHQACFYLGAFYCTHIWSTTNRIVQTITGNGDSVFFLLVMHAFFDPFQGFLNYLVYQRPRYIQMRKKYPDLNAAEIGLVILRFSYMGEYVMKEPKVSTTEATAG